jgi:hypothetical protein
VSFSLIDATMSFPSVRVSMSRSRILCGHGRVPDYMHGATDSDDLNSDSCVPVAQ